VAAKDEEMYLGTRVQVGTRTGHTFDGNLMLTNQEFVCLDEGDGGWVTIRRDAIDWKRKIAEVRLNGNRTDTTPPTVA
jgi:hypothetical protein